MCPGAEPDFPRPVWPLELHFLGYAAYCHGHVLSLLKKISYIYIFYSARPYLNHLKKQNKLAEKADDAEADGKEKSRKTTAPATKRVKTENNTKRVKK